jgi:hypothetical protein
MKHPAIQEAWNKRLELRQKSSRVENEWLDLVNESHKHISKMSEIIKDNNGDPVTDDNGYTYYTERKFYIEGERLRAEGKKKQAKCDELNAEGDRIYCEAVIEKYGKKAIVVWRTGEIDA